MPPLLHIEPFFDEATHTVSYLVWDSATASAAIIDPVLDYDHRSGQASTRSAQAMLDVLAQRGLQLQWILETHVHADHLSAAPYLRERTGAPIAVGEHIRQVQGIFRPLFNLPAHAGEQAFDRLLGDGECLPLGELTIEVLHTPGHTPACVSYCIEDAVFVGDTLFMPDYGTARADFPGGDARVLYRSIQRLLALPSDTRLFMCHDYKAPGRSHFAWESTVAAQRQHNVHVHTGVAENSFVTMRQERDTHLAAPALLLPAIQVNLQAGQWPEPESNGTSYLKIPLRMQGASQEAP